MPVTQIGHCYDLVLNLHCYANYLITMKLELESYMQIILWEVPDFRLSTGSAIESVDMGLGKMPLLYRDNGTAITCANNWLIYLKANRLKKEVNTQAQALLHFFTFLADTQCEWDHMPVILRQRPTYAFKKHLREAFHSGLIARSTANSYMRVVINFYKFYLFKKHTFANPPFNYEYVKVQTSGRYDFMRNNMIYVESTDLRLNLPRDARFNGLSRALVPLSEVEWQQVEKVVLTSNAKGISQSLTGNKEVALSEEFRLAVMLARYAGLRRDEIISLRNSQIFKPSAIQLSKKYLIHAEGLLLDPKKGIRTKGGVMRYAEIPTELMQKLHIYINSERYIIRKEKFIHRHPDEATNPPLFINQYGDFYSGKTIDARWGELRNLISIQSGNFEHKFHNLRSTYAVHRLKELLNNQLKEADALDYLQACLGHKHRATLFAYLRFCKQEKSANAIYENALETILEG